MTIPSQMNNGLKALEKITTARYLPDKTSHRMVKAWTGKNLWH